MFAFRRRHDNSPTIVQLVRSLVSDVLRLVRTEIDLVRARFSRALTRAVIAVALLLGAATLAFLGGIGLLIVVGLALAIVLPGWAAALIVSGALLLGGAAMCLLGLSRLRAAMEAKSSGPVELEIELQETRYRLEAELESLTSKLDPRHRSESVATNGRARSPLRTPR